MKNFKLEVSYLGTNYCGFQRQLNGTSVQELLEKAIFEVTKEQTKITASGRTDAGVHAYSQVVNFLSASRVPALKMPIALNQHLPDDIRVLNCEIVDLNFNARKSAKRKTYIYKIFNGETLSPFDLGRKWHVKHPLDLREMQKFCDIILGKHDFRCCMASGSSVKDTVREIYDVKVEKSGDDITFSVTANGFLYNMVRILVGSMVEVGAHKRKAEGFARALAEGKRAEAGRTAPACGLYLKNVEYI